MDFSGENVKALRGEQFFGGSCNDVYLFSTEANVEIVIWLRISKVWNKDPCNPDLIILWVPSVPFGFLWSGETVVLSVRFCLGDVTLDNPAI